ncbi:MAG: hypothetical protein IKG27_04630 [Bacilli bacterium]|nr:hypothetical protein [Bacilli bacterium]
MNLVSMLASSTDCISSCGTNVCIPSAVAGLTSTIIFIIKVVVPVLLVLWGMLDFAKAIIGQDEDKIKAGQKKFIQRLIAAIIVFLVTTVVSLVVKTVGNVTGDTDTTSAWTCADALINGR